MAKAHVGGLDTFNSIIYGMPHQGTLNFLQNTLEQSTQMLTDTGRAFMTRAHDMYEKYSGETALRRMRAAGQAIASRWQTDIIKPLATIAQLQTAPPVMHRWLMAEPTIRNLYQRHRCDGYGHSYIDNHPGAIGEEHLDYRMVMDGIVEFDGDGGWYFTEYVDDLIDGDRELFAEEQFDILRSWEHLATAALQGGDDPTSVWNAELA